MKIYKLPKMFLAAKRWATRNDRPEYLGRRPRILDFPKESLYARQNAMLAWLESRGHKVDWR